MGDEKFVLYAVQANGDKALVETFATLNGAMAAAATVETPSIERVTVLGSTVLS